MNTVKKHISKFMLAVGALSLSVSAFAGEYHREIEQDRFAVKQQEVVVQQQRMAVEQQVRVLHQQERRLMELRERLRMEERNFPRHTDFRDDRPHDWDGRPDYHR